MAPQQTGFSQQQTMQPQQTGYIQTQPTEFGGTAPIVTENSELKIQVSDYRLYLQKIKRNLNICSELQFEG